MRLPLIKGAFRAHSGLWSWGLAPQGQLMMMSSSVRESSPISPNEGLKKKKKMHQETKVRARTEVLVLFIVDNLCPACSTGGPAGRMKV